MTIADPGGVQAKDLLGRELKITSGDGKGQTRFVIAAQALAGELRLTLGQPFRSGDLPSTASEFRINVDDAIVGTMTAFEEFEDPGDDRSGLPPTTAPEDKRTTFTDSVASFPFLGEGLTGATLQIVGGSGAGQQRLILGQLDAHTLILNGAWSRNPVEGESLYRIQRYQGLAIPSVEVQVNDNDQRGVIVDSRRHQRRCPVEIRHDFIGDLARLDFARPTHESRGAECAFPVRDLLTTEHGHRPIL